jgi:hypothetical protein
MTTKIASTMVGYVNVALPITEQDLRAVLSSALGGGIGYWCRRVALDLGSDGCVLHDQLTDRQSNDCTQHDHYGDRLPNESTSEWVVRMLIERRTVNFWVDAEPDPRVRPENPLVLSELLLGIQRWMLQYAREGAVVTDGALNTPVIDAVQADVIVQLALFGEVVYG